MTAQAITSTPSFSQFNPAKIKWQAQLVGDLFHRFDYSLGAHEILLSGAVGSGKSLPAAHCALRHLLTYSKSRVVLARRAMPDLRDTIFAKVCEHLEGTVKTDGTQFKEGRDYGITWNNCKIWFCNGSEIISRSWADKNYKKLGSVEASAIVVEELTENDGDDETAIKYLRMRVGRLPHVPQQWIIYCTNPDAPSHFAYDYFQIGQRQGGQTEGLSPTRHVYFSLTEQNPYLPPWYISQLKQDLDPKMARRMLMGEWLEITKDVIYYAYSKAENYINADYVVKREYPIGVAFDFNIADGKPLSACLFQYVDGVFHFYAECVVEGLRTLDICEEMAARGLLDHDTEYLIYGDATGARRDTRSKVSDYDLIMGFMQNYAGGKMRVRKLVPLSNPPIRDRHNKVNAYCCNAAGERRLFVYKGAPMLDKGLRLTALKKGGSYIEDDSAAYQHVTTAAGYGLVSTLVHANRTPQRSREL